MTNDGGSGERRHVARSRSSEIESPDELCGYVCIRRNPEVGIGSDALNEIFLGRVLVEELKAIRTLAHQAVELAASFKWKIAVVGVRSIVRAYLRQCAKGQSRISQRTRRQLRRNWHRVNKNLRWLWAIAEVATRSVRVRT